ncbi:MAG: AarF/ABC1/UbiB kinase family protein [Gammaproteobacteria bacterium]|nr:MAG: AarF/ABC1/UbiB kinase family protein [Gammaproteobacteria bacterium]
MASDKRPPATRTRRMLKLAGMTASVASRYAASKVRTALQRDPERKAETRSEHYEAMAETITETLGQLKGAVMKVGQIASQTQDFLPKEFAQALQRLQKEAPPMPWEVIAGQVTRELGAAPDDVFQRFDREPWAAASIGQVHRARTHDGREVIVKVQYPGVDDSVDADLRQLKLTFRLSGLVKIPPESLDALFEEIRERLSEELDYENEARNLVRFRRFHEKDEGVIIPAVIRPLSSRRVLTLEYVEGDHIEHVKAPRYSQAVINVIGHRLFRTMADQLFRFQAIHGDPHAGNFAFRPDGTLILYDFGCVKDLKPEIVARYRDALKAALREDYGDLDRCLIDLGVRVKDQPAVGPDYYAVWRDVFIRPFDSRDTAYDYGAADLHQQVAKNIPLLMKHIRHFQPPVETLFIDRMIAGHYWMLKRLGVQAAFRDELERYLAD